MIPTTVSLAAEQSLRRLADLAAVHVHTEHEVRQIVIACATILEVYTDSVIEKLIMMSGVAETPIGAAMRSEIGDDTGRNWRRRSHWFGIATGSPFLGEVFGQRASTLIDLRNALAHGTGGLSRVQSKEVDGGQSLVKRLTETLAVQSVRGNLRLGPPTARLSTLVAREFILAIDAIFVRQGNTARSTSLGFSMPASS